MTAPICIWGAGTSRTLRALWAATELDLDYQHRPIGARTGETQAQAFITLNPKGKIPVLVHGDVVLSESAAIVGYLSQVFPSPAAFFAPRDAVEQARLNEWCYFIMTELDAHSLYVIRRHDALRHIYGPAPEAVESARTYFSTQINAVAARIESRGPFLMGELPSVADILMKTTLDWASSYSLPLPASCMAYAERLGRRAQFLAAIEANQAR